LTRRALAAQAFAEPAAYAELEPSLLAQGFLPSLHLPCWYPLRLMLLRCWRQRWNRLAQSLCVALLVSLLPHHWSSERSRERWLCLRFEPLHYLKQVLSRCWLALLQPLRQLKSNRSWVLCCAERVPGLRLLTLCPSQLLAQLTPHD
jgi:hypothetical protein